MRKKTKYKKHPVKPDEKYNSVIVGKLTNKVMKNGERRIARRIVYQAAEIVEKWYQENQKKVSQNQKSKVEISPATEEKKAEEVSQEKNKVSEITASPFLTVLKEAIRNTSPDFEVRRRKVGSGVHRTPVKIEEERGQKVSLRWIVTSAQEKTTHNPMSERLAEEIINACQGTGKAFERKEAIRKEIENR